MSRETMKNNHPGIPMLLTVEEVAAALRTTPKAVYALVARGELPGVVRYGRRLLFDASALVASVRHKSSTVTEGVA